MLGGGGSKVYNFKAKTDEHWKRGVLEETTHTKGGSKSAPVPSGLGMNHAAQSFRSESVSVERAMRNTHLHKQMGVTRWFFLFANYSGKFGYSGVDHSTWLCPMSVPVAVASCTIAT